MKFTLGLKRLPFEQLRTQIIYTEGRYDEAVNAFIRENYERIRSFCALEGFEFCYLPRLSEEVKSAETLFYNAPYAKEKAGMEELGSDFILTFMSRPENKEKIPPSLLYVMPPSYYDDEYWEGCECLYEGMSLEAHANEAFEITFFQILNDVIWNIRGMNHRGGSVRFRIGDSSEINVGAEEEVRWLEDNTTAMKGDDEHQCIAELSFDEEASKIADEIYQRMKLLEKKGFSRCVLEQYISGKEKLSRLHITADFRILLPDYNNIEIQMTPLPKAVFILFLRHAEGIPFKFLFDYREELASIYRRIRPTASTRSIESVVDPTNNSINEKCARIREAFVSKFDEHLAENYFITGKRGEPKKIRLPRKLIKWDEEIANLFE